jgi:hypothetical protein
MSTASALKALREYILARQAAASTAKEQPMLQGLYRGYAGERGTAPVMYHGGTYAPGAEVTQPLYMTRDPAAAASYAQERGGSVVKLQPRFNRTAAPAELERLAAQYVPDNARSGYTPASALDAAIHGERDVNRLIYEMQRNPRFYDSARGADLDMLGRGIEATVALPGRGVPAASAEELFLTPQRRVADYYAQKRAAQTGEAPHAEMVLVDPRSGRVYGHSTMGRGSQEPMTTRARKIRPEDVKESTQLYRRGGLAQLKECSYHG